MRLIFYFPETVEIREGDIKAAKLRHPEAECAYGCGFLFGKATIKFLDDSYGHFSKYKARFL